MNLNDFGVFLGICTLLFLVSAFFFPNGIIFVLFIVILVIIMIGNERNKRYSKRKGAIKPSRIFLGKLEIHIGNEAKGNKRKFFGIFIDNIIWAKENNIECVEFYSWLNIEDKMKGLLGDSVTITKPNFYQAIGNQYINFYYWRSEDKNPLLKITIDTSKIDEEIFETLKQKSIQLNRRK